LIPIKIRFIGTERGFLRSLMDFMPSSSKSEEASEEKQYHGAA